MKDQTGIGPTSTWKEGDQVMGNANIAVGTPIATFNFNWDGRPQYGPQTSPGGKSGVSHTGLYMGQDANGVYLLNQYNHSNGATVTYWPWNGVSAKTGLDSENGSKYYTISNFKSPRTSGK